MLCQSMAAIQRLDCHALRHQQVLNQQLITEKQNCGQRQGHQMGIQQLHHGRPCACQLERQQNEVII